MAAPAPLRVGSLTDLLPLPPDLLGVRAVAVHRRLFGFRTRQILGLRKGLLLGDPLAPQILVDLLILLAEVRTPNGQLASWLVSRLKQGLYCPPASEQLVLFLPTRA